MNFLNKSNVSTREVVEELEKTKHKLQKSQTRLINLSAAYKALQEEKKTLEATISAISSGGGNDESSSESPEGEEKESPDDETQDNPKIAKLTGMSKFYRGTSHKL